jgi:hypothetical protein
MTSQAAPARPAPREREITLRTVTVIMGTVVGLSFLFTFGNVWALALRLGVPRLIAPLVAPAVDLSVVGLLLATRYLAVHGAGRGQLRPARHLLIFVTLVTLALNVAEPVLAGFYGRAAFDSVGCLVLAGWAHVGPGLLQAISQTGGTAPGAADPTAATAAGGDAGSAGRVPMRGPRRGGGPPSADFCDDLLERARAEDARHRELHHRPISAETLRKRLNVGAARSRSLVARVRADTGAGFRGRIPASPAVAAGTS